MSLIEAIARRGHEWTPQPNQNETHPILAAVRDGNVVYVSGQIPSEGEPRFSGKVTAANLQDARLAAELCALHCLEAAASVIDDPEDIVGINKLLVFVNVGPYFNQTSIVANGASDFLIDVLGEAGKHARSAIGVQELPLNALVETEMVVRVR